MRNETKVRKLTLKRETVRALSDSDLELAAGGYPTGTTVAIPTQKPSCMPSCLCKPLE